MTSTNENEVDIDAAFTEFKRKHGLDDWTVRFTADELRARDMAEQYRDSGFDVRVLPLTPAGEEIDATDFGEFDDLEHDPLQYVEVEACAGCLDGTHVLLTNSGDAAERAGGLDDGGIEQQ